MGKAILSNYREVNDWLEANGIGFYTYNNGTQYRIFGDIALIDLWPAHMTVHVIATEAVDPNQYFKLDKKFNPKQLQAVLDGKHWRDV